MKNNQYIVIEGWMVNELGLKGNELLIYAIIYGFSQEEGHTFHGTLGYLAEWVNASKQGVIKNLKSLVEKGLIQRIDSVKNGVNFVEYYTTEFNGGVKQSLTVGIKQSLTINNTSINNLNNNIVRQLEAYTENEDLRRALRDFASMRKTIKKPMTPKAIEMLFKKLDQLGKTDGEKIAVLDQSTFHSWQSIYELKDGGYRPRPQTAGVHFENEREPEETYFDPIGG